MTHYYFLEEKKYNLFRQIILAICLLVSVVNLVYMITSIVVRIWINLIYVFLIWLMLLIIRIAVSFLVYKLDYNFNNDYLIINKIYPLSQGCKLKLEIDKIESIIEFDDNFKDKIICLCPKSCTFKKYVVKYQNSAYLLALDEYGYCLLNRSANDLFR